MIKVNFKFYQLFAQGYEMSQLAGNNFVVERDPPKGLLSGSGIGSDDIYWVKFDPNR